MFKDVDPVPEPPLFDVARFEKAPCYLCGYNGPEYFQPATHKCANGYHAAIAAQKGG